MRIYLRVIMAPALLAITGFLNPARSQPDHFTYAVTDIKKDGNDWIALRKLNTQTGAFSEVLLNGSDKTMALYDNNNQVQYLHYITPDSVKSKPELAFGGSVAAIAFDRETNRLYYTPMYVDQLRYIDLATMKVFCITGQSFGKAGNYALQPLNPIARMVIAPDSYGYTITNDGNHFFRFNTKGNTTIADLGELQDDATSKETIHNACGNAGGDLVADDDGNLYLITGSNKVFKVDINTKHVFYQGTISGLPQKFVTNGAAIDEEGNLLISTSVYSETFFSIDTKTWKAFPYKTTELYKSSDLANGNVLLTKTASVIKSPWNRFDKIKVYPNPVADDQFNVQFNNLPAGNYTIHLIDGVGAKVLEHKVSVTRQLQTELISISGYNAQGFYFLRIVDENNKTISTQKLVIER